MNRPPADSRRCTIREVRAWGGKDANVEAAQAALAHRARMNGLARDGRYAPDLEGSAA